MEFIVILIVALLLSPIVLSIIAIVKVSHLQSELATLKKQLRTHPRTKDTAAREANATDTLAHTITPSTPDSTRPPTQPTGEDPSTASIKQRPNKPQASPHPNTTDSFSSVSTTQNAVPATKEKKNNLGMEFMMGGKAAAFLGISILVIGVVLLVGYAIQNNWVGPTLRVLSGLVSGAVLVALGHWAEKKHTKFQLLARVLTGGGCSLFYFTVFAAHHFYQLIGPYQSLLGLLASALATFALATVYRSQIVGVLGTLGAFITPMILGGSFVNETFPLIYVAIINIPVILFGLQRKWQLLYNISFVSTVIYFVEWNTTPSLPGATLGLTFALIFFFQYATLGLLKLKGEHPETERILDIIRLLTASVLLLFATHDLMSSNQLADWIGLAFLINALIHIGLAFLATRILKEFNREILGFLSGGLLFAVMALPAQLDGVWVSLGWAIEGVILAVFASKMKSNILQFVAIVLGMVGIGKTLLFDFTLFTNTPHPFLNTRFIIGLLSCGLLGVQGFIISKNEQTPQQQPQRWIDPLYWITMIGITIILCSDLFWTLGAENQSAWFLSTLVLFFLSVALFALARVSTSLSILGCIFLLILPFKILFLDALLASNESFHHNNEYLWGQLLILLVLLASLPKLRTLPLKFIGQPVSFSRWTNLLSIASGMSLITLELFMRETSWADSSVTIFWATTGLLLIVIGMKRSVAAHRYFGLTLFALSITKVLFFDSSELNGLARIFAYLGTGILLLLISFIYQKATAFFERLNASE